MFIVKTYGRNDLYDFTTDKKLSFIKYGEFSDVNCYGTEKQKILALDSFMTIWLLTLPEKFMEWCDKHKRKMILNQLM